MAKSEKTEKAEKKAKLTAEEKAAVKRQHAMEKHLRRVVVRLEDAEESFVKLLGVMPVEKALQLESPRVELARIISTMVLVAQQEDVTIVRKKQSITVDARQ